MRSRLAEVPGILGDLQVTISRQDQFERSAGHTSVTPLSWNEDAAIADQRLRAAITTVALDVASRPDERDPLHPAMAAGCDEVSRWLIRNRHILAALPAAGEHFEQLDRWVVKARVCTDRPPVRARFFVAPCPEIQGEGDAYPGRACPGECWATIPSDEDDLSKITCLTCHHSWDSTQWTRLAKRLRKVVDQRRFGV